MKRGDRKWLDGVELPSWPGAAIRYKGQQLEFGDPWAADRANAERDKLMGLR